MCLRNYIFGKTIISIFIFLASFLMPCSPGFAESTKPSSLFNDLIDLLEQNQKENKQLLLNWSDYLFKVKGHTNEEFLLVIENLTREYAQLYISLNKKIEDDREQDRKNYSSEWIEHLLRGFGEDFVRKNKIEILWNLMSVMNRVENKRYDPVAKELMYREALLYGSYREYFEAFLDYYGGLKPNEKQQMETVKGVADRYLTLLKEHHFAHLYTMSASKDLMRENKLKRENGKLYAYCRTIDFPFGSSVASRASDDLERFVDMNK